MRSDYPEFKYDSPVLTSSLMSVVLFNTNWPTPADMPSVVLRLSSLILAGFGSELQGKILVEFLQVYCILFEPHPSILNSSFMAISLLVGRQSSKQVKPLLFTLIQPYLHHFISNSLCSLFTLFPSITQHLSTHFVHNLDFSFPVLLTISPCSCSTLV